MNNKIHWNTNRAAANTGARILCDLGTIRRRGAQSCRMNIIIVWASIHEKIGSSHFSFDSYPRIVVSTANPNMKMLAMKTERSERGWPYMDIGDEDIVSEGPFLRVLPIIGKSHFDLWSWYTLQGIRGIIKMLLESYKNFLWAKIDSLHLSNCLPISPTALSSN